MYAQEGLKKAKWGPFLFYIKWNIYNVELIIYAGPSLGGGGGGGGLCSGRRKAKNSQFEKRKRNLTNISLISSTHSDHSVSYEVKPLTNEALQFQEC